MRSPRAPRERALRKRNTVGGAQALGLFVSPRRWDARAARPRQASSQLLAARLSPTRATAPVAESPARARAGGGSARVLAAGSEASGRHGRPRAHRPDDCSDKAPASAVTAAALATGARRRALRARERVPPRVPARARPRSSPRQLPGAAPPAARPRRGRTARTPNRRAADLARVSPQRAAWWRRAQRLLLRVPAGPRPTAARRRGDRARPIRRAADSRVETQGVAAVGRRHPGSYAAGRAEPAARDPPIPAAPPRTARRSGGPGKRPRSRSGGETRAALAASGRRSAEEHRRRRPQAGRGCGSPYGRRAPSHPSVLQKPRSAKS